MPASTDTSKPSASKGTRPEGRGIPGGLEYRPFREEDLPGVLRLWEKDTDWGRPTPEAWGRWYAGTPAGPLLVIVAVAEGAEVVGQFAFAPSAICARGELIPVVRPFAPIISQSLRGRMLTIDPLELPTARMFAAAIPELVARGHRLSYMVAHPHWMLMLKLLPHLNHHVFPLWSRPLPLERQLPLAAGHEAFPITAWDERIDRLWDVASRLHGCLVVRNAMSLRWKVGGGDHRVVGVERGGEMVGLVASHRKGEGQWLICDLLSADLGASLHA